MLNLHYVAPTNDACASAPLIGHGNYAFTPAGLLQCYIAAIPFDASRFSADLLYSGVLFGGYELVVLLVSAWRKRSFASAGANG